MKKETIILLALLGFGLYTYMKSKPSKIEEITKDGKYYDAEFRKIYDSVNGDTSKAIPLAISLMKKDQSFQSFNDNLLVALYEDFVNRMKNEPNFGL